MSDPRNVQLPPVTALPDSARPAVEQFHTLRDKLNAAQTVAARLWHPAALQAAERADLAAATKAATAGKDPAAAGRPAAEKLAAERDDASRTVAAYEQALADAWLTGVTPALRKVAEHEMERWRAERDTRSTAVTEAVATLRQAEQRWYRAAEMVSYYTRMIADSQATFGGLAIPSRGVDQPERISAHLVGLERGLALVPTLQDGPARRTEPDAVEPTTKAG